MTYALKRLQYSKIYKVNERTIRRWQDKEMSLDDPAKLLQELVAQKNKPASLAGVSAGDLWQHWLAESDPEEMHQAVRLELAMQVEDALLLLWQARNLARKRWKEWPEFTSRINAIAEHTMALHPLLGFGDDDDIDRDWRPQFLAGEGHFHIWGNDPDRKLAQGKRLVWAEDEVAANVVPMPVQSRAESTQPAAPAGQRSKA